MPALRRAALGSGRSGRLAAPTAAATGRGREPVLSWTSSQRRTAAAQTPRRKSIATTCPARHRCPRLDRQKRQRKRLQAHRQQRQRLLQHRHRRSPLSIASWATGPHSRIARRSVAAGTCRDIERLNRSSTVGGHAMRTRRPKSWTATRTRARWTALWATGRTGLRAARSAGADRRRAVVRWRWTLRTEATSAGVRTRLCRVTSSRVRRRSPQQHLR